MTAQEAFEKSKKNSDVPINFDEATIIIEGAVLQGFLSIRTRRPIIEDASIRLKEMGFSVNLLTDGSTINWT